MRWTRALTLGVAIGLLAATSAEAADELSVTDRLQDRREVAAGTRAYSIGFQDGRFYANGWHITGEMGGVWTPPVKLLDGLWFGVDGQWAGPATKFTSGKGYTRFDLPPASGLTLRRTDFVPDGTRAALFGLELTNPGAARRTVTVKVDARSELMGSFPWSFDGVVPNAKDNLPDTGSFDGTALKFTDVGTLPGGAPHDYTALVAADRRPDSGTTGAGYWGAQAGTKCAASDTKAPSQCDDGPFGNGTGGELSYTITVGAHRTESLWVAAAGSDRNADDARAQLAQALNHPDRQLARKAASRQDLSRRSQVDLPGDRLLQNAVEWGKQNLADLTQTAENLQVRYTDQGKAFPAPAGTVPSATFFGAGYPDYPWLFATDGEYTAFAAVSLGQFETIEAHLRALRDVSDLVNDRSGKVAHEIVQDGSVYFGGNADPGNTDETVKFPSIVALIWRWTGDDRFRDDLYDFSVRNLRYVTDQLDADHDGWPEGLGNVERTGMGAEKLDNSVYYIRGLLDLADLARSEHDWATARWAGDLGRRLQGAFDSTWWSGANHQYADSLENPGNTQNFQGHWIGVTPMEVELPNGNPGLAPAGHAAAALSARETDCYSGTAPYNAGLFHTGCGGGPTGAGERTIYSLTTSIAAVGEGNYGRLGAGQQQRYTDANAAPMFEPDEQPGALPEILPSPDFGDTDANDRNIDRCWTCRAMFLQAWGQYGVAWPVIHQQLGVDPSLGDGRLDVIPQVPPGQRRVAGDDIRLGDGSVSVLAAQDGDRYVTTVETHRLGLRDLLVGAVVPAGSRVKTVRLDGRRVRRYQVRSTNRGLEVAVDAPTRGYHVVTVRVR